MGARASIGKLGVKGHTRFVFHLEDVADPGGFSPVLRAHRDRLELLSVMVERVDQASAAARFSLGKRVAGCACAHMVDRWLHLPLVELDFGRAADCEGLKASVLDAAERPGLVRHGASGVDGVGGLVEDAVEDGWVAPGLGDGRLEETVHLVRLVVGNGDRAASTAATAAHSLNVVS